MAPQNRPQLDAASLAETVDYPAEIETSVSINRFGETVIGQYTASEAGERGQVDSEKPSRLGKYEIVAEIGRGAFGMVYRGRDAQLARDVAIKVPRLYSGTPSGGSGASDSRESTRKIIREFLQEARQLAQLKHPGIVTVLDVDVQDDDCLIVSEFLDGPNLNEWMIDRAVPWQETIRLVSEIADALAYAHSQSTVHRDLKPGNIILVERGDGRHPVLVDFGLAVSESLSGRSQLGVIAGTPNYMSPEQARGEGHRLDGRTDIYALGVILYRMLCGVLPFAAPSISQLLTKVLQDEPVPPHQLNRGIPRELENICLKAMSKDIADRYTTAGDLAAELRDVLRHLGGKETAHAVQRERSREAVRRQVTVLCCRHNLLESAEFVERLEPEQQYDLLLEFQKLCEEAIQENDGRIVQLSGGSLLVCFGYPTAYEDAARRATGSALILLARLKELSQRLKVDHEITLKVQAGIHTGVVVVQERVGESGAAMLLTGEARHVATRLTTLTEDFTLTVTGDTARLLAGYFECAALGSHRVTGAARNLELHRVLRRGEARSRMDVVERTGLTPLVGRDTEVEILKDLWEQANEGLGQVVCVIGEAGLGKSRLIREITEHVVRGGEGQVVEWRASPFFTNTGLHPAIEAFGRILELDREPTPIARLNRLEQHLAEYEVTDAETVSLFASMLSIPTGGRYPPLVISPLKLLEKTLDALLQLLRQYSAHSPLLFIVEDLHWIDPTSLQFLGRLLDQGLSDRLLTLLTFRPEFETPWGSRANQTQLALNRLTRAQIEEMMLKRTGLTHIPAAVVNQIIERTEGVPLFVEEYSSQIQESGALREVDGRAQLAEGFDLQAIPATLQDLLVSRLDRLHSVQDVAQLGATIGRRFTYEVLHAVSPLDAIALQKELEKLVGAEILFQEGTPPRATYTFKHALIQDAAYESLLKKKRVEFHQRIGDVLEQQFPEVAETEPELLAQHFTKAGAVGKAIQYWLKAGQRSQARSATLEAISQLQNGLDLVQTLPDGPERFGPELQFRLGLSASLMGAKGYASPEARAQNKRARELCEIIGAGAPLFPVMMVIWAIQFILRELTAARGTTDELRELAQSHGDQGELTEAWWASGCNAFWNGEFAASRDYLAKIFESGWYDEGVASFYAQFTQQNSGPLALAYWGLALSALGYADQARAKKDEAVALSAKLKHPFTTVTTHWQHALMFQLALDGQATEEWADKVVEVSRQQAFAFWEALGTGSKGAALSLQGRHEEAIALLQRAVAMVKATGCEKVLDNFQSVLAEALWKVGRRQEAWDALQAAFALNDNDIECFVEAELHRRRGDFLAEQSPDETSEAEAAYQRAIDTARRQQAKLFELRATTRLCRLWHKQGRSEHARVALTQNYEWFTEGFDMPDLVAAKALLGELS